MAIADETHTNARVVFSTDPSIGVGPGQVSVAPGMQVIGPDVDVDSTAEALPIVLFEPAKAMVLRHADGHPSEAQVDSICTRGFKQWLHGPLSTFETAIGWTVGRTENGLELRDDQGNLWAEADLELDPEWVSAATSQHYVLVIYGTTIGVRTPPRMKPHQYTDKARKAEIIDSRKGGAVAAAIVQWQG